MTTTIGGAMRLKIALALLVLFLVSCALFSAAVVAESGEWSQTNGQVGQTIILDGVEIGH